MTCTNSQGKCDAATRPRDEEECEDHTGCYEWKTGDWSKVTVNTTWCFLSKCKDVQSAMLPSAACVNLQFTYLERKGLTGFDWSFCCDLNSPCAVYNPNVATQAYGYDPASLREVSLRKREISQGGCGESFVSLSASVWS